MQKSKPKTKQRPAQHQNGQPGIQHKMKPLPVTQRAKADKKLNGMIAVITGGDSGIGRAVAVAMAEEGARILISYLNEHKDAEETARLVKEQGGEILLVPGDIRKETHCRKIIAKAVNKYGGVDILVNNAAVQFPQEKIEDITPQQLLQTFQTNIFSQFYLCQAALPHMKKGSAIINTTSVTAYRGSPHLLDYSATKGAIVSFTRSLSALVIKKGIRVNAVAPGPIWTPLIPATFPAKKVAKFGSDVPMKRAGEPAEVASCYIFLASKDSSYITGQVLHPNGGGNYKRLIL